MRLTKTVTLIDREGNPKDTRCHPLQARGSVAEEAGIQIPLGGLQLVVWLGVANQGWAVRYQGRSYEVISVIPYIKRRIPQREVLICSPVIGNV